MIDMILDTAILPEQLLKLIDADKIRVTKEDNAVTLTPISEKIDYITMLEGSCDDGKLTVAKHLEWKHEDKEYD
jgi:virulence-associated protein VagC